MHPGPVNRGVELSPDVVDVPQSLITEQVAAGVAVRMAVFYELLAGRGPDGGTAKEQAAQIQEVKSTI
jgi:aspartate carbamoyltransferase catalytic subunit